MSSRRKRRRRRRRRRAREEKGCSSGHHPAARVHFLRGGRVGGGHDRGDRHGAGRERVLAARRGALPLVCLNDESLAPAPPGRDNACLLFAVFATIFLACETLIGSFVGDGGGDQADGGIFVASLITAVVLMVPVCWYVRKLVKARGGVTYSSGLNVSPSSPGRRTATAAPWRRRRRRRWLRLARGSMGSATLSAAAVKLSDLRDTTRWSRGVDSK